MAITRFAISLPSSSGQEVVDCFGFSFSKEFVSLFEFRARGARVHRLSDIPSTHAIDHLRIWYSAICKHVTYNHVSPVLCSTAVKQN